jgi:putative polyhydroxyalkanoate system protein
VRTIAGLRRALKFSTSAGRCSEVCAIRRVFGEAPGFRVMEVSPMPKFTITRNHSLPAATIKERIDQLGERLKNKFQAKVAWNGDKELGVKGTGVDAKVTISDNKVDVFVDLSMMLTPMKGKIEGAINEEIDKVVSGQSAS